MFILYIKEINRQESFSLFLMIIYTFLSFFSITQHDYFFKFGDNATFELSSLTSDQFFLPIDLPSFCNNESFSVDTSLASNLIAKTMHTKQFKFQFQKKLHLNFPICSKRFKRDEFNELIEKEYVFNMNLNRFQVQVSDTGYGLPIGQNSRVNNHFALFIHYKKVNKNGLNKITGLSGIAESKQKSFLRSRSINTNDTLTKIDFYITIQMTTDDTKLDDDIVTTSLEQVLYFVLILVNLFIIGILAYLSTKNDGTKDFSVEDDFEDNIWYFMRGDIFRLPNNYVLLSSFTQFGFQLFMSSFLTAFFKFNNGTSLLNRFFVNMIVSSPFSSFISMRLFKMSEGKSWRKLITYNALIFPVIAGVAFLLYLIFNAIYQSSLYLTYRNIEKIIGGLALHIILSMIGSFISLKIPGSKSPFKVNLIPKQPVKQPFYLVGITRYLIVGGYVSLNLFVSYCMVINMMHGFQTISISRIFTFETLFILFLSSFASSFCFVYLCVKGENYKWWWNSFVSPSFCGVYYFVFAVLYFVIYNIGNIATFARYAFYHLMIGACFGFAAGFSGFVSCFLFLRILYETMKSA